MTHGRKCRYADSLSAGKGLRQRSTSALVYLVFQGDGLLKPFVIHHVVVWHPYKYIISVKVAIGLN